MGVVVSSSHVVSASPSSSLSSPAPAWGPSHGRQSFTNCSNMSPSHRLHFFTNWSSVCPFHGVLSFRYRLFQHGYPIRSQALPANLLQCGLLSPQVLPGACSSTRFAQGRSLLQTSTCSSVSLPWAAGGDLLHCGPPWASGAQPASPWSSPRAAGESLLWCLEHLLLPSCFTDLGVCRTYSHTHTLFKGIHLDSAPLRVIKSLLSVSQLRQCREHR